MAVLELMYNNSYKRMYKHQNSQLGLIAMISYLPLRSKLIEMLDQQDLVNLLCLNRSIKEQLLSNSTILSRIYFMRFLKHREMFTYSFCDSQQYKKYSAEKVEATLQNFKTESVGKISTMKAIKMQLGRNLKVILPQMEADSIVEDVFETMVNPMIPMPSLRKQTVGDYCQTSLQVLMAELNHRDNSLKMEEQPYCNLKAWFIENHEIVLEQLVQNKNVLVNMRFQSQLIDSYESTNSPFLNIINVFLTLIDYHLETICRYLSSQLELPSFEFLCQFTKRYNTFRDMVMSFEDKLGFMMELFTKAFNFLEKQLEIYPGCSIWRTLMKKWVNKMRLFEDKAAEGFIQLLTKMRQNNFKESIEESEKLEECSQQVISNYLMNGEMVSQNNPLNSEQFQIVNKEEPDSFMMILRQFVEYTVDVSSNEYSIHWCQSTSQKLNKTYTDAHLKLLESTKQFYKNWGSIFGDNAILQIVLENDIQYLRNFIKPATLKNIIQQANILIDNSFRGNVKHIKGDFERVDDRIKHLNERRMIPIELGEEYKQFFDFDKTIRLDKIESRIKNVGKKENCDKMEIEESTASQSSVDMVEQQI